MLASNISKVNPKSICLIKHENDTKDQLSQDIYIFNVYMFEAHDVKTLNYRRLSDVCMGSEFPYLSLLSTGSAAKFSESVFAASLRDKAQLHSQNPNAKAECSASLIKLRTSTAS